VGISGELGLFELPYAAIHRLIGSSGQLVPLGQLSVGSRPVRESPVHFAIIVPANANAFPVVAQVIWGHAAADVARHSLPRASNLEEAFREMGEQDLAASGRFFPLL
jgi:hypothetical protein